jgi:5'-nucleotidase
VLRNPNDWLRSAAVNMLLTNDDGITAPGLWAAARALAKGGQVTILAPTTNDSGYGAVFPPSRSFTCSSYRHLDGQPRNVTAYALAGTSATCVHVGLHGLPAGPFDLVVSGINHGANLGRDVFYSGTVGAALTAHLLGVPAIAISLDAGPAGVAHWEAASLTLSLLSGTEMRQGMPGGG